MRKSGGDGYNKARQQATCSAVGVYALRVAGLGCLGEGQVFDIHLGWMFSCLEVLFVTAFQSRC